MVSHPGHDFTNIILHDKYVLEQLLYLVTTLSKNGVMNKATDIPPHVKLATQMKAILSQLTTLTGIQKDQTSTLVSTIENSIDKKAYDFGNINESQLREILASHQSESANLIDSRLVGVDDRLKIQESLYQLASSNENHRIVYSK